MNVHFFITPPLHPGWTRLCAQWQAYIKQGCVELSTAQLTELTWSHLSSTNPLGFNPPSHRSAHTYSSYLITQPDLPLRSLKTHSHHMHAYVKHTQCDSEQVLSTNDDTSTCFQAHPLFTPTKNKNRLTAWHLLLWLDWGSNWGLRVSLCNWSQGADSSGWSEAGQLRLNRS